MQAQRLQVETLKWRAAKLPPRAYGDKVAAEVSGPTSGSVPFALSPMDWDALMGRVNGEACGEAPAGSGEAPAASGDPAEGAGSSG
jgi:hypothetical protein